MDNRSCKGFTLVELLVVLAIIGVLAALLFPVFSRAKAKAQQTTCVSNQRQIGAALSLYLQDFDETYPNFRFEPLGSQTDGDFEKNGWRTVIAPYLRSVAVMRCPANQDNRILSQNPPFPVSYAANMAANPRDFPLPSLLPAAEKRAQTLSGVFGSDLSPGVKASSIVRPAECIAVVEMAHNRYSGFEVDVPDDQAPMGDGGNGSVTCYSDCLFMGHAGLSDYLFADGHVKALKPTATYQGDQTNYWYRDASPLSTPGRETLANAQARTQ